MAKTLRLTKKRIWNEAVIAVLREVNYYDGLIPEQIERDAMVKAIFDKIAYKGTPIPKFKYRTE